MPAVGSVPLTMWLLEMTDAARLPAPPEPDPRAALRTYQRRCLGIYDERVEDVVLPDERPQPWPGADRPAA